ncbi:hypothetical protein QR685DRAFT_517129 [Neurospora intermedia]|uniref:Secreted protein n=1 Tax=Neurospora intermedia TaxID=5142 RepID=A0ABR3DLI8_NEUIN
MISQVLAWVSKVLIAVCLPFLTLVSSVPVFLQASVPFAFSSAASKYLGVLLWMSGHLEPTTTNLHHKLCSKLPRIWTGSLRSRLQ